MNSERSLSPAQKRQALTTTCDVLSQLSQKLDPAGLKSTEDTKELYLAGCQLEEYGRHFKRLAVAAEYNSGRSMEAWYRELRIPEETGRMFVKECRRVGLIGVVTPTPEVSKALLTQMAAREYAKAPDSVKESIKTEISKDPNRTFSAKEINGLIRSATVESSDSAGKDDETPAQAVDCVVVIETRNPAHLFGFNPSQDELDVYTPIAEQFELLIKLLKQAHNDNSHPQFAWSSYSAYLGFASDLVGCHYSPNN